MLKKVILLIIILVAGGYYVSNYTVYADPYKLQPIISLTYETTVNYGSYFTIQATLNFTYSAQTTIPADLQRIIENYREYVVGNKDLTLKERDIYGNFYTVKTQTTTSLGTTTFSLLADKNETRIFKVVYEGGTWLTPGESNEITITVTGNIEPPPPPPPNYAISCSFNPSDTVVITSPDSQGTVDIEVTSLNNYQGTVEFRTSPSDLLFDFTPTYLGFDSSPNMTLTSTMTIAVVNFPSTTETRTVTVTIRDINDFNINATLTLTVVLEQPYQTDTKITVQPSTDTVNVGNNLTLEIWVENVTNFVAYDIKVSFDSSLLSPVNSPPATIDDTFISRNGQSTMLLLRNEYVQGTPSYVWVANSVLSPLVGVNGSGVLFRITFQALSEGITAVDPFECQLSDANAVEILYTKSVSSVTITTPSAPTGSLYVRVYDNYYNIWVPGAYILENGEIIGQTRTDDASLYTYIGEATIGQHTYEAKFMVESGNKTVDITTGNNYVDIYIDQTPSTTATVFSVLRVTGVTDLAFMSFVIMIVATVLLVIFIVRDRVKK